MKKLILLLILFFTITCSYSQGRLWITNKQLLKELKKEFIKPPVIGLKNGMGESLLQYSDNNNMLLMYFLTDKEDTKNNKQYVYISYVTPSDDETLSIILEWLNIDYEQISFDEWHSHQTNGDVIIKLIMWPDMEYPLFEFTYRLHEKKK